MTQNPCWIRRWILAFTMTLVWGAAVGIPLPYAQSQAPLAGEQSPALQDRAYLGAFVRNVDDVESRELGITTTSGAVVVRTVSRSPASLGGLRPGDVITEWNGKAVLNASSLNQLLRISRPGDQIQLSVLRKASRTEANVTLSTLKLPDAESSQSNSKLGDSGPSSKTGPSELSSRYRHPMGVYQIQLPAEWSIHRGRRGNLADSSFDTLEDPSKKFLFICPHQPLSDSRCSTSMEEIRRQVEESGTTKDMQLTGYSNSGVSWIELSYRAPESGQRITRLIATPRYYKCFQFVLVGRPDANDTEHANQLAAMVEMLRFSAQNDAGEQQSSPPIADDLPVEALPLKDILQTEPRVVGITAVSVEHPNAISLGVQASQGAVITEVFANSSAALTGFRPKDVVVRFGQHDIRSLEDFQAAIWSSPLNSIQELEVERGDQRLEMQLRISADTTRRLSVQEYIHGTGGYQFHFFPRWRLHPNARREEQTDRVYDLIESEHKSYQIYLYHDRSLVKDPNEALDEFITQASSLFSDGSSSGRRLIRDIPLAYVAGPSHRSQHTVYRIAFVIDSYQYEMLIITPPMETGMSLPLALQAILGSMKP